MKKLEISWKLVGKKLEISWEKVGRNLEGVYGFREEKRRKGRKKEELSKAFT